MAANEIDLYALRFCRITTVIVILTAIALKSAYILFFSFLIMAFPAIFSVRYSPFLMLYEATLGHIMPRKPGVYDAAALRFAQGFGASLLLIAIFCITILHTKYGGWFFAFSVAAATAVGAGGYCAGAHIYYFLKKAMKKNG